MTTPRERLPDLSTPFPEIVGRHSGSFRIDPSSIHPDEAGAKGPWAGLAEREGYAELTLPDCVPVRRRLPLEDVDAAIVDSLRKWMGDDAVKHWLALRRLRSSNGRTHWKLDAHLEAIGDKRDDAEARIRAAREVERLTGLQVTVTTPNGDLRLRAPLLVPITTTERNRGGFWLLDDMTLRVHPMLTDPWPSPVDTEGAARQTAPPTSPPSEARPQADVANCADATESFEVLFSPEEADTAPITQIEPAGATPPDE